jgi:hypothetical protein
VTSDGAIIIEEDGGTWACHVTACGGHLRNCGDCMDNDGDGRVDAHDPDCLGPCDNNEAGFYGDIPGSPPENCIRDCYFDQDDGPGNDTCQWDFECDPLAPGPDRCVFSDPPPASAMCPDPQGPTCHELCEPLTPNGCDCFGCCELPALSGNFVYIGSYDSVAREGTCRLGSEMDPDLCHPCTPVTDCFNGCTDCEVCIGRAQPPDNCDELDAGVPSRCSEGIQECGLPGDADCPVDHFCVTGCCIQTII